MSRRRGSIPPPAQRPAPSPAPSSGGRKPIRNGGSDPPGSSPGSGRSERRGSIPWGGWVGPPQGGEGRTGCSGASRSPSRRAFPSAASSLLVWPGGTRTCAKPRRASGGDLGPGPQSGLGTRRRLKPPLPSLPGRGPAFGTGRRPRLLHRAGLAGRERPPAPYAFLGSARRRALPWFSSPERNGKGGKRTRGSRSPSRHPDGRQRRSGSPGWAFAAAAT